MKLSTVASPGVRHGSVDPARPARAGATLAASGNAALSTLSASQRERLSALFAGRMAMAPIKVGNPNLQQPADPARVFELRKNGVDYALAPTVAGAAVPALQGQFMYVILADDPGRIHIAAPPGSPTVDGGRFGVEGHTSLSKRRDVLYAGELVFDQGRLTSWGNSSGHYTPGDALRHTNLLPSVKAMLPNDKFVDFWHEMTPVQRDAFMVARGYTVLVDPIPVPDHAATPDSPSGNRKSSSGLALHEERLGVGLDQVNMATLAAMGATLDGVPVRRALHQNAATRADIAERLSLDGAAVAQMFKGQGRDAGAVAALLEVAAARTGDAPLITPDRSRPWIDAMNQQLGRLKGIDASPKHSSAGNPITYLLPGGGAVQHVGAGLQAFGVYTAVRGIGDAVARGEPVNAAINGAGLAAQAGSVGLEAGVPRLGNYLGKGNLEAFNAFADTPLGMRMGGRVKLGAGIGRAASGAATVLTLPFDIYSAVSAFRQAGAAEGKQQQDHLVDGGFAVAGAVSSLGLAGAAAAGLSAAGPIGIAVGAALAGASHLYHSVRYVEDIERHVPLSHTERFATGLSGFLGGKASQPIQDKVSEGQAREQYRNDKRHQLQSYLPQSPHGAAIFGDAVIRARPPVVHQQTRTVPAAGGPYIRQTETVAQQPATVQDNAGDDSIDASAGLRGVANLVSHPDPAGKSVLWVTGGGKDKLNGVLSMRNVFEVGAGEKDITGGRRDDRFDLMQGPATGAVLNGGQGQDTLALRFSARPPLASEQSPGAATPTVRVVLPTVSDERPPALVETGTPGVFYRPTRPLMHVSGPGPSRIVPGSIDVQGQRATLLDIEHVTTSATARTAVTGNREDNMIVLNGEGDSADGGGGNDTFVVNGGGRVRISAGQGNNRYVIGRNSGSVGIDNAAALTGKHHLQLDADIGEVSAVAAGRTLEIRMGASNPGGHIVLSHAFGYDKQGHKIARLADGDVVITTRHGYLITPLLSSIATHANGRIALVVQATTARS